MQKSNRQLYIYKTSTKQRVGRLKLKRPPELEPGHHVVLIIYDDNHETVLRRIDLKCESCGWPLTSQQAVNWRNNHLRKKNLPMVLCASDCRTDVNRRKRLPDKDKRDVDWSKYRNPWGGHQS